jgi:hypothetical protein
MHKKVPVPERGGASDLAGNPDYETLTLVTAEGGKEKTFLVGSHVSNSRSLRMQHKSKP